MAVPRPRARTARYLLAVAVGTCFLAGGVAAVDHDPVSLGPGLVTEPADATTLVSVQGFHFQGTANRQKPVRLAAAGPRADLQWRYESRGRAKWFYDVDPLPDGNVLVTSTVENATVVFAYDPENRTRVWERRLPIRDTHDVDMLSEDELVAANMRE